MRKLTYVFNNGIYTTSLRMAKKCGNPYKTVLTDVRKERQEPSPIAQAMIEQFGYVSKKFKDKVVLK